MCLKFMYVLPIKICSKNEFQGKYNCAQVLRGYNGITQKLSTVNFLPPLVLAPILKNRLFSLVDSIWVGTVVKVFFNLTACILCFHVYSVDCLYLGMQSISNIFKYIQIIYSIYQSLPFAMVRCSVKCWARLRRLRGLGGFTAPSRSTTSRGCCPAQRRKCPQPRCMLGYSS